MNLSSNLARPSQILFPLPAMFRATFHNDTVWRTDNLTLQKTGNAENRKE